MTYDLAKIRRYWQLILVIAVITAIWWHVPVTFCAADLGFVKLVCPVGFLECCLSTGTVVVQLLPGFLLCCVVVAFLGRAFCAWACPARMAVNAADCFVSKTLVKRAHKVRSAAGMFSQTLHSSIQLSRGDGLALTVGLFAGIALFSFPAYSICCPIGVICRNVIECITHFKLRWDLILLIVPLSVGFLFSLGWKCACPVGLFRGTVAEVNRTLTPVVDPAKCNMCGKCLRHCESGIGPHGDRFDSFACSKCLNCLQDCNRGAVRLKILPRNSKECSYTHAQRNR